MERGTADGVGCSRSGSIYLIEREGGDFLKGGGGGGLDIFSPRGVCGGSGSESWKIRGERLVLSR